MQWDWWVRRESHLRRRGLSRRRGRTMARRGSQRQSQTVSACRPPGGFGVRGWRQGVRRAQSGAAAGALLAEEKCRVPGSCRNGACGAVASWSAQSAPRPGRLSIGAAPESFSRSSGSWRASDLLRSKRPACAISSQRSPKAASSTRRSTAPGTTPRKSSSSCPDRTRLDIGTSKPSQVLGRLERVEHASDWHAPRRTGRDFAGRAPIPAHGFPPRTRERLVPQHGRAQLRPQPPVEERAQALAAETVGHLPAGLPLRDRGAAGANHPRHLVLGQPIPGAEGLQLTAEAQVQAAVAMDARAAIAGLTEVVRQGDEEHDLLPSFRFPHRFTVHLGVGARMGTVRAHSPA